MASIVVSDVGGHHFPHAMYGRGSAHQQAPESPAVHQSSVRPSPVASAHPPSRTAAPDILMADDGHLQPGATSQHTNHIPPPSPRLPSQPGQEASAPPHPSQSTTSLSHQGSSPAPSSAQHSPAPSLRNSIDSSSASPRRIKVKNLAHIQSFASEESTRHLSRRQRRDPGDLGPQYEISSMPVGDIIEMVAGLLTKITTTNDQQHEHLHRNIPPIDGTSGLSLQTSSVLAFHGKNVPSISILSYLTRIHKYCPTTYEVFLSLLVYFDRMTERVNAGPMQSLRQANQQSLDRMRAASDVEAAHLAGESAFSAPRPSAPTSAAAETPPPSGSLGAGRPVETPVQGHQPPSPPHNEPPLEGDPQGLSRFFVVDSFNIHRLVIAGVTCASKFFSDVFYTNSRYAKVGGLPLVELNHLELQFLLLNDFRLQVPLEEMEAYGTMLVEFYAREVAEQGVGGRSLAHAATLGAQ